MSAQTPKLPPPLSQYDVETPLRDLFKRGEITSAAAFRKDRDHSQLDREILASFPDPSSLWRFYNDLDSFYRTRYELGADFFALACCLNARYALDAEAIEAVDLLREMCGVVKTLGDRNASEAAKMAAVNKGKGLLDRCASGLGLQAEDERPAARAAGK